MFRRMDGSIRERLKLDPMLRGGHIERLVDVIEKRFNIAVTCRVEDCRHRGVVSAIRLYWHIAKRGAHQGRDVTFRMGIARLCCSRCGGKRLEARATTDAAEDALEEPDWTHGAMSRDNLLTLGAGYGAAGVR